MTFGCLFTHTSTPVKNDQPVKKYDFWSKFVENGNLLQRTSPKLLNRFSWAKFLCRAGNLNCVVDYITDLSYKPFQSYSRFSDTDSMESKNGVKWLEKNTIKLTFSLKTDIFIVFTVIGNIPDLKVRLLTGIGLSSGYLQIVKFSLFFGLSPGFFLFFG